MEMVRDYDQRDEAALAVLWHEAWHFSHADSVPEAMLPLRELSYFQRTLPTFAKDTRVIGPVGAPYGFYLRKGNYVDRLFVGPRKKGYGAALLSDVETQIKRDGHQYAELSCLVENTAARRFYESNGWELIRTYVDDVPEEHGGGTLNDCIYRKNL